MFHVKTCTRCKKNLRIEGQRWCRPCFNAYMREYRRREREKRQQGRMTEQQFYAKWCGRLPLGVV